MADLRHRAAEPLDHRQHLQRRDKAVAGGREVGQDDVAGLLAADVEAVLAHVVEHVAVADRRAHERQRQALEIALEPVVGHHGGDDAGLRQPAVGLEGLGDDGEQLVAVDDVAVLVGDDHAVGVAVERDADVGAHLTHFATQFRGRGRAAIVIDVEAVGADPDRDHFGAELPQPVGHHPVGGAVGAVDHDAQAVEAHGARQRALGEFDVAVLHAVDALGAAEVGTAREPLGEVAVDQLPRSCARYRR